MYEFLRVLRRIRLEFRFNLSISASPHSYIGNQQKWPTFVKERAGGRRCHRDRIAKELGISPAYLSYMVNGKRPWRKDLYQRYMGVVNTFVSSEAEGVNNNSIPQPGRRGDTATNMLVGVGRIELPTSCSQSRRPTAGLHPDCRYNLIMRGRA